MNLASQRWGMLKTFLSSSELTIRTKIDLQVACIFSRLLHPCCRNVDNKSRRFQKTPGVRNGTLQEDTQSVLERQSEQRHCQRYSIGRHCKIVDVVKQRKLQLFCRMNDQRLVKIVMLGMVEGDRPRGRPARRWSNG